MIMKQTKTWRIEWYHVNGYQAPSYYVETKNFYNGNKNYEAALRAARERSRLSDFPEFWKARLILQRDEEEE